ncbi:hypothetical protein BKA65DRAFT_485082 [Rhexocercosporidium sp. MPI-PUGE-AT-0058]|nr:hypothetical protein BKA65DRAFT_485082 [Rhexocercosporidium sp. MPI-PUGE-AT-0058]
MYLPLAYYLPNLAISDQANTDDHFANEIRTWVQDITSMQLNDATLRDINLPGDKRFSGQTIDMRGYLMLRVLRPPPQNPILSNDDLQPQVKPDPKDLRQNEDQGIRLRTPTESVQVDAFNILVNAFMVTIQTSLRSYLLATSDQIRFQFGDSDAGTEAAFNACIDGIQAGLPSTEREQRLEYDNLTSSHRQSTSVSWKEFTRLPEYASLLEAKAKPRSQLPGHKSKPRSKSKPKSSDRVQ